MWVLGLGNEEGGEGDVFAPPESVARDPREDVLAVRCAGDGNIALPEKLDPRGDGVPYFRVVQFGMGGTEPSSVTQMRPYWSPAKPRTPVFPGVIGTSVPRWPR